MVRGRGRTSALDSLWRAAHGGRRLADPRRQRALLAPSVRAGLWHHLRRRPLLYRNARAARSRRNSARAPTRRRRPLTSVDGRGRQPVIETASQMTDFLPVILPLVWAAILAFAVFLYVLLGGY